MGLFGGRGGEVGTFVSPHSLVDTRQLVLNGVADQLHHGLPFHPQPLSITNSIVLTELTDNRVVVCAGNIVTLLYRLTVDLTDAGNGSVHGHAYLDRPFRKILMWPGNAMHMLFGIQQQLESASVSIQRWKSS